MTSEEHIAKVAQALQEDQTLLEEIAGYIIGDGLLDGDTHDLCERVCVRAFGERVECPVCGSPVLPTFLCWGCEEWTAT